MVDIEPIEDITVELIRANTKLRKELKLPADMENPAAIASRLTGLARHAAELAQAILIVLAHNRERELIAKRFGSEKS